MFNKIAGKIKSALFKAQNIQADSAMAKAQSKLIDGFVDQADVVADIAIVAANNVVKNAKKEATKAVSEAKKKTAPKASTAKTSTAKAKPKKTTKY